MKIIFLLALLAPAYFAQPSEGSDLIDMGGDVIKSYEVSNFAGALVLGYTTQYSWSIIRAANGDKTFTFSAKRCDYYMSAGPFLGIYIWTALPIPRCVDLSKSAAMNLGPIAAALAEFYNYHPSAPHLPPVYNPSIQPAGASADMIRPARRQLTTVQPISSPDPQMIFLDGLSYNAIQFDLTTNKIVNQVVVPSTSGPMGIRPVASGPQNEIWAANGGLEVTVADFGAQKVVTNILTPSVPQSLAPVGIAFTSDGTKAFEAVSFYSPDSSGNNGALLVFDAVKRTVTSTFPLKTAPSAMVVAPDGSTVYLLSNNGLLTYYDVLSGTADLSVSTYTPGQQGGYPGNGVQVFIHPDGTRLFWNINYLLVVFDLTTRKMTALVNTGLPSTATTTMQMSQDGATLWLTNGLGTVAAYDVRSGSLEGTFTTSPASVTYPGPVQ